MGESVIELIDPIGAYLLNEHVVGLDIVKLGGSPQAQKEQCHIAPQEQAFFFKARDGLKGSYCFFIEENSQRKYHYKHPREERYHRVALHNIADDLRGVDEVIHRDKVVPYTELIPKEIFANGIHHYSKGIDK